MTTTGAELVLLPLLALFVVVALAAATAAAAIRRVAAARPQARRERFEGASPAPAGVGAGEAAAEPAAPPPAPRVVAEERVARGALAQVVDTRRGELGRCLLLGGRVLFCERDAHKHHEMLVHFPAAHLRPDGDGGGAPAPPAPRRVLLVGGADCLALREVLKYGDALEAVVVIEPDEALVAVCERHFMASRAARDPRVNFVFAADVGAAVRRLHTPEQLRSYDLVLVDAKDRPEVAAALDARGALVDLRMLLREGGVLAMSGDGARASLRAAFAHTLEYGYHSEARQRHERLALGAGFDLAAGAAERPRAPPPAPAPASSLRLRFYNPALHWQYVPWFAGLAARAGGGG